MSFLATFETGKATEKLWVSTEAYRCADLEFGIRFKFLPVANQTRGQNGHFCYF